MPFVSDIVKYDSLSIVGLEKNTGKTEALNYILRRLPSTGAKLAVTSIGIDGEQRDQVTRTPKPEITLFPGMIFSTAESYYRERRLLSNLLDISDEESSMGRILSAEVIRSGKVLLAGPSSTQGLQRWMKRMGAFGADLKIVDGALSRLSLASPAVSSAMILSTGAAYSAEMNTLVNKTKFIVELISAPLADDKTIGKLEGVGNGIWGIDESGEVFNITKKSSLLLANLKGDFLSRRSVVYVAGALTDAFLRILNNSKGSRELELIVDDFTKVFATEQEYRLFLRRGGRVKVMKRSKLIAVCVNPTAPNGYVLDSDILCRKLEEAIHLPVYDIVKNRYI